MTPFSYHFRRFSLSSARGRRFAVIFFGLIVAAVLGYRAIPAPMVVGADVPGEILKISFQAPVTLHFSQRMNKSSVEKSFRMVPFLAGDFAWPDGRTLIFSAYDPLPIGSEFKMTVGGAAKNFYGKRLKADAVLSFVVTGAPYARFVSPRLPDGEIPVVEQGQPVIVLFDRPMDLATHGDGLLVIEPPAGGRFRLLGESAFQFIPEAWAMNSRYKFTVPAGLASREGGATEKEEVFYFDTPKPRVIRVSPTDGEEAATDAAITLRFNQPVELGAVRPGQNIQLFPSNDVDAEKKPKNDGFFNMEATYGFAEDGSPDKNILTFTPTFPYLPGREYRFVVKAGKELGIAEDLEIRFKTKSGVVSAGSVSLSGLSWVGAGADAFAVEGLPPRFFVKTGKADALEVEYCRLSEKSFFSWKGQDAPCALQPKAVLPAPDESGGTSLDMAALFGKKEWEAGLYFLSVTAKGVEDATIHRIFVVSGTVLVLKKSEKDVLVWAVDVKTGQPVARMELVFYGGEGGELARGTTDSDGIYKMAGKFGGEGIYVVGKKERDGEKRWAVAGEYWNPAAGSAYGVWLAPLEPRAWLFPGRNILTAGEDLAFKGIVRTDADTELSFSETVQVSVLLQDETGDEKARLALPLRRDGSFDGIMLLPESLEAGDYKLAVFSGNEEWGGADIKITGNEPPFSLEWENARTDYKKGEMPLAAFTAHYPFGLPAAHLMGGFRLYRTPFFFGAEKESAYSYGPWDRPLVLSGNAQEELLAAGDMTFDKEGRARLPLIGKENSFLEDGFSYRLEVSVRDFNGEILTRHFYFRVHPCAFYAGLGAKRLLMRPDEDFEATSVLLTPDGVPVEGEKMKIVLSQEGGKEWFSEWIFSGKEPVITQIPVSRDMPGGIYFLRAEYEGGDGNVAIAEKRLFLITPEGKTGMENFVLVPDQSLAYVGGKARFLAVAPFVSQENPAALLFTVERMGILRHEMVPLLAALTPIEIPVDEAMVPNVYVKAAVLRVSGKQLDSLLEAQKKRAAEEDSIALKLMILEEEFKGVPMGSEGDRQRLAGEIQILQDKKTALGEEDGALPDLALEEQTVPLRVSRREQEIKMDLSFDPPAPKPGDTVKIRFHAYDYKNQDVPGIAAIRVTQKGAGPGILGYFLGFRPLQVATASSLAPMELKGSAVDIFKALSGLKGGSAFVAYFNPLIVLDNGGYAEVEFKWPENGGPWAAQAVVTEGVSRFGEASVIFPAKSLYTLDPLVPRYVMPGDRIAVGAFLRNVSENDISGQLEMAAEGFSVKDFPKKEFSVKAGQSAQVLWQAEVPAENAPGQISLIFRSREENARAVLPVKTSDAGGPLEEQFKKAAAVLPRFARADGGYFYWENAGLSDPLLSAYALYALDFAKKNGEEINDETLENTARYLVGKMADGNLLADEKAAMLWALSEYGEYDTALTLELFRDREALRKDARFLVLKAIENHVEAGQSSLQPYVERLKSELNPGGAEGQILPAPLAWLMGWPLKTSGGNAALDKVYCRLDDPECLEPVAEFSSGEVYAGRLTLIAPED
ncbi:Ig-like domain-containing protein, partial [Candidatus Peregrinibacteria bacterium]|nr:Ig-like domain-containing protein [Candidatus Peregrinibacteria bacterium]